MDRRDFLKSTALLSVGTLSMKGLCFHSIDPSAKPSNWIALAGENLREDPQNPAPGRWEFSSKNVISGEKTHLELRYTHGDTPLPPNSYHKVVLEVISIETTFHCPFSNSFKVVPLQGTLPEVEMEVAPVNGVGFRDIKFTFPEGLKAGERFAVVIGNDDGSGQITALINPFPCENLACPTYTNFNGTGEETDWQQKGWAYAIPRINVKPAKASELRIFGPTLIERNKKFNLRIAVTDHFDSRACPEYQGSVLIESDSKISNLPEKVDFAKKDHCTKVIRNLMIEKEGVYRIKARLADGSTLFESNPIVVKAKVDEPIYWGNIHNHGCYSECWGNDMDTFYAFARDISGMDFVSMSDHLGQKPTNQGAMGRLLRWRIGKVTSPLAAWKDTVDTAQRYNQPGSFVTLIGYELSGSDSGHYNIYIDDPSMDHLDRYFPEPYTDYAFAMRRLLSTTDALYIPHIHAGIFPWTMMIDDAKNKNGDLLTPAVEVYSDWGTAMHPYAGTIEPGNKFGGLRNALSRGCLEAWDKGYIFATTADSDSHTGLPGRRIVGGVAQKHDHPQGLTAVRTNDFTRRGIMQGYRDMKTYGTTGERIYLNVTAADKKMGETLYTDKPFDMTVEIAGTDVIEKINIFDGLKKVAEKSLAGKRQGTVRFEGLMPTDQRRPYIVEVVQKDENCAWSTPIWVIKKSLPQLTWQKQNDQYYLVNTGNAPAENVRITYAPDEHPLVAAGIPGRECEHNEQAGFAWTEPRSNYKTLLHYRWHGDPIKGKLTIEGAKKYEFDYNREFHFFGGELSDDKNGQVTFSLQKYQTPTHSQGFDVITEINPDEPCRAIFELQREVKTLIGDKTIESNTFTISLNGRKTNKPLKTYTIGTLRPQEKWPVPEKKGFFAANADGIIVELDKSDNLLKL